MQRKVIVTTDTGNDLPLDMREEFGIHYIPLHVTAGDLEGLDGVDIFPADLHRVYNEQVVYPKTAAPSIGEYQAMFGQYTDQGYDVVHVPLGANYSSSCQAAQIAASTMPETNGEVYVVDSGSVSGAIAMISLQAACLRDEGVPAKEIAERLNANKGNVKLYFYLESLDMVAKGGRVQGVGSAGNSALAIHPSFWTDGQTGTLQPGKKYRGQTLAAQKAFLETTIEALRGKIDPSLVLFVRTTSITPEADEELCNLVRSLWPEVQRLVIADMACTCLTHAGFDCVELVAASAETTIPLAALAK